MFMNGESANKLISQFPFNRMHTCLG